MSMSREESSVGGVIDYTAKLSDLVSEIATHMQNDEVYKVKKGQMDRVILIATKIISIAGDFREVDSLE